jgi:hydroxymethylpyrimidine/phosphomethylpyrimidine kinase
MAPVVLTVAGFDSSGAAGVAADLTTFAALGVHGAAAVTVVTAQGGGGIVAAEPVSTALVLAQIEAVCTDLAPGVIKLGLLGPPASVDAIAGTLAALAVPVVMDPVLVDGLDRPLVGPDGIAAQRRLAAGADVLTPNRRELGLLIDAAVRSVADVVAAADTTRQLGAPYVVITGGRDAEPEAVDVLVTPTEVLVTAAPRVPGPKRRGTGCTFSAAIAAALALGQDAPAAVTSARAFVQARLADPPTAPGAARPGCSHLLIASPPSPPSLA